MPKSLSKITEFLSNPFAFPVIITTGLVIRLTILVMLQNSLQSDAIAYHTVSGDLLRINENNSINLPPQWLDLPGDVLSGKERLFFWQPGLTLLLAACYSLFGYSILVGRVSTLMLWLLFAILLYNLTSRLSGRTAANCAILFFTFYPIYIYQSVTPLTQLPTSVTLLALILLVLTINTKYTALKAVVGGMILGYLILLRTSNLPLIVLFPILFWLHSRKLQIGLSVFTNAIMVVASWMIFAYNQTGRLVLVNDSNTVNFFRGNNSWTPLYRTWWFGSHAKENVPNDYLTLMDNLAQLPMSQRNQVYLKTALKHILDRPDLFILRTFSRVKCFFAFDTVTASTMIKGYNLSVLLGLIAMSIDAFIYLSIMLLTFFYFAFTRIDLRQGMVNLLIGIILVYSAPYFISWGHPNYRFAITPLFSIFAATALIRIINRQENPLIFSPVRWRSFFLAVGILTYIQIEWIVISFDRL